MAIEGEKVEGVSVEEKRLGVRNLSIQFWLWLLVIIIVVIGMPIVGWYSSKYKTVEFHGVNFRVPRNYELMRVDAEAILISGDAFSAYCISYDLNGQVTNEGEQAVYLYILATNDYDGELFEMLFSGLFDSSQFDRYEKKSIKGKTYHMTTGFVKRYGENFFSKAFVFGAKGRGYVMAFWYEDSIGADDAQKVMESLRY